jgi:hypothetical protein
MPANGGTWMILIGCGIWSAVIPLKWVGVEQLIFTALPLLFLLSFSASSGQWRPREFYDLRSTRVEIRFGGDIKFNPKAPNAQLIESYLGPMEPHWSGGGGCNYPIVTRRTMPAFSPNFLLRDYLALLPDEPARRQVVACLTDPKNNLRMHQSTLLILLKIRGYPPGYDRMSWWAKHQGIFVSEPDLQRVVDTTLGWSNAFWRSIPSSQRKIHETQAAAASGKLVDLLETHRGLAMRIEWSAPIGPDEMWQRAQHSQLVNCIERVAWWPRVK